MLLPPQKIPYILLILCHIASGLIPNYDYNDQLQVASTSTNDLDLKLATMDPNLYRIVKDPDVKIFTFELEDAVTGPPPKYFEPTKVPELEKIKFKEWRRQKLEEIKRIDLEQEKLRNAMKIIQVV